jgi:hypothetical protein
MKGSGSVSFMKPSNSTTVTHKLEYTDLYNRYSRGPFFFFPATLATHDENLIALFAWHP